MADLQKLKAVASRKQRPTRRQRAQALLLLHQGRPSTVVAQTVGINKSEVEALANDFEQRGIAALDRGRAHRTAPSRVSRGIEKTHGVCGGDARIAGTRIPVWQLVEARSLGASEAQLLSDYPNLRAEDLVSAWSYERSHREEIERAIHQNEVA
jgi:uncharacterized protein (DUF433 family)